MSLSLISSFLFWMVSLVLIFLLFLIVLFLMNLCDFWKYVLFFKYKTCVYSTKDSNLWWKTALSIVKNNEEDLHSILCDYLFSLTFVSVFAYLNKKIKIKGCKAWSIWKVHRYKRNLMKIEDSWVCLFHKICDKKYKNKE